MIVDSRAHREAMARLADRYFEDQWRRLGPIKGVPGPRKEPPAFVAPELPPAGPALRPPSRMARKRRGPSLDDFDPQIPRS